MPTELVELPSGSFRMSSTSFYPEEAPIHTVSVEAFAVERHPVTNAEFAEFVTATKYVTVAEQPVDPAICPGADAAELQPGAMVDLDARRQLAASVRAGQRCRGPGESPGGAGGLSRRRSLCALGRATAADRSRMGVRRARRGDHDLRVGRRREAR